MTGEENTASMSRVTDLHHAAREITVRSDVCDEAMQAAEAAASTAGVHLRELTELTQFEAVSGLYHQIWRPGTGSPPITTELLRALTKAGNYVAGAFADGRLVGACVGFFSAPADGTVHSHIAGVSASARRRNVGFAMKLHQRAWALQRGVSAISWTFDPLVRRNAYFNLSKLAAAPAEYLPNFYGGMNDGINGSDDTDRLLVRWELEGPSVVAACRGVPASVDAAAARAAGASVALDRLPSGGPVLGPADGPELLVAVPEDIERLRSTDPDLATQWRTSVRDVLGPLLAGGARVRGFDRAGWFVVGHPDQRAGEAR